MKLVLTAAMAMTFATNAALADCNRKRIDHPNGRPTFMAKPNQRVTPVGVYADEQGLAVENSTVAKRTVKRTARLQLGRGQYIPLGRNSR